MKKRFISLALVLGLALSLPTCGAAAVQSGDTALETVRVLGIITGDEQGDMKLSSPVTRAEFVKMMAAASSYKDSVGGAGGASLFKDVKSGHWAGEYIKLGVEQGWFTGYVDGTFRPENTITLEEACTALLRLLGYDSGSLAGSFPTAQLSKAGSIGLLDDMTAVRGQTLTRRDCVTLFYNLLTVKTSGGAVYGTTLGYTITNGEVDYSSLVSADLKGPYVAGSDGLSLPFGPENVTVYRNGSGSSLSAVKEYDVYYYNANLRTVWVYSSRVTGTLTGISPDQAAPTAVSVAGTSYSIGTSSAAYKFSSQGSFTTGSAVTLLLGMNGEVVDVIGARDGDMEYYGVVISSEKTAADATTTSSDTTSVQTATRVACSDGAARTFYHSGSTLSTGRLVSVTMEDGDTKVQSLSSRGLSGTVNSAGTRFAGYDFADDVEIIDTDEEGGYIRIYPSRLAGAKLTSEDVLYYTLNEAGDIDRLILRDVTGDTDAYIYLTSARSSVGNMSVSGSYQYLKNGESYTINSSAAYNVSAGGAVLIYDDGSLKSIRQLSSVTLTGLSDLYAMAGNQKYALDENVQVLLKDSGSSSQYYPTSLSEINASDYTLKGWYDDMGRAAGGRIRIIVATPS